MSIRMHIVAAVALVAICCPNAWSQPANCADLVNPDTLNDLSSEEQYERYGDCPVEAVLSSDAFLQASGLGHVPKELVVAYLRIKYTRDLAAFGYGLFNEGGTVSDQAIRDYQEDLGDPTTGMLTLSQAKSLEGLTNFAMPDNIWIGGGTSTFEKEDKPTVSLSGTYLRIEGSWWLDGPDRIADPLNRHIYRCDLEERTCEHAEASLTPFSADQLAFGLFLESLEVSRVALPMVEIVPLDDSGCRRPVITVNTNTGDVFQVTTQVRPCDFVGDLEAPRVARLRSGYWQSQEYRDEAAELRQSLGSTRLQQLEKQVQAIQGGSH